MHQFNNACNIGDVIAIYRYENSRNRDLSSPSGIGVVLKVYDESRCFVRLLVNFSIPQRDLKGWKKIGVRGNHEGYYVRSEDKFILLYSTIKTTYVVSPTRTYATKLTSRSNSKIDRGNPVQGYLKTIPGTSTEVYFFNETKELIPRFVLIRDLNSGVLSVVTEKNSNETVNEMCRRAYAYLQISNYERVVK